MSTRHPDHASEAPSFEGERDFVSRALARFPITRPSATPVADSFNTVYRVNASEGDFMLRVNRSPAVHHPNAPHAEEAWTAHFSRAGLDVPRPLRTHDGDIRVTEPSPEPSFAMLLTWVPGTPPTHPVSHGRIVAMGELSARLHRAAPPTAKRPDGVLNGRLPTPFEVPDMTAAAPSPYREVLARRTAQAREWISDLWEHADEEPRVLHFDLTPRNVVFGSDDGAPAAIDFQDLAWGHRAQDVANTLYGMMRGGWNRQVLAGFRRGYERHCRWPEHLDDLRQLRRLFVARRIAMVNLALTLRRPGLDAYLRRHADALTHAVV